MNEQARTAGHLGDGTAEGTVNRVLAISLLLLGGLMVGSWWWQGQTFAVSVLIGGVLTNGSFWLLKKDARRLLERVGASDDPAAAVVNMEKTRFFLRMIARWIVLGLLLFALAAQVQIHVIGLTLGLATVMVSVVIFGFDAARRRMPSKV